MGRAARSVSLPPLRHCRACGGSGLELDPVAAGAIMKAARKRKRLSLRALAELVGCSHVYIADMEAGRRPQTGEVAQATLNVLGVHL